MDIENDALFRQIGDRADWFGSEARQHKRLNRALWSLSSCVSLLVAICSNMKFGIFGLDSSTAAALLSIVLPVLTGYTVFRNPESLWILEVDTRNKLLDLKQRMYFASEHGSGFDRAPFENEYFSIMGAAAKGWKDIRQKQANA